MQSKRRLWTAQYRRTLNEAAQHTPGRPFGIGDYRVSCVGREELTDEHKQALRQALHSSNAHEALARAHWTAAGYRKDYFEAPRH